MLFNSISFAIFLPVVFGLYWSVFQKHKIARNLFLLIVSYVFYGLWDWRFLGLIIISSLCDFFVGIALEQTNGKLAKKSLLAISLTVNLGILGFFKYFNFFLDSFFRLQEALGMETHSWTLKVLLPIGISFYTFQTVAYTIDVYRGTIKPTWDPIAFFAFVAFFPQLVAGPIERAKNLMPQFNRVREFRYPQAVEGLRWILWGMFKKLVIADRLAVFVEQVFHSPEAYSGPWALLAIVFFGFQVYCDFSGYSAIAIGTAKLFGFDLMVNFRTPFFSTSLKEFWNRWHISLSTWFRDYIYFPIGGSRKGWVFWAMAIMATFLTSGLWHGAAFTFICFGLVHGIWYLIEQTTARAFGNTVKLPKWAGSVLTLLVVNLAWPFFRAKRVEDAFLIIGRTFQGWEGYTELAKLQELPGLSAAQWFIWPSILLMFVIEGFVGKGTIVELFGRIPRVARWGLGYFLIGWILLFGAYQLKQSFVYFQF